jgi:Uma2 family endonuclease
MVEVKLGLQTVDLPYTIRIPNVSESLFDSLVDEDTRAELINGVMFVHSPATMQHDDLSGFLRPLMRGYAERKKLGKVYGPDSLVRLGSGRKFAPDIYFLRQNRVPRRRKKQFIGVPDLGVEVLSPTNRHIDLEDKRFAYQQAGIKELWLVDPLHQTIIVDRRRQKSYTSLTLTTGTLTSEVLQGFWIEVDWLWQDPLPELMDCLEQILA